MARSLKDIEGTTELELSVESEGATAAAATARATQAVFTAVSILTIGVLVYWVLQIISAHAIWNTKFCAFLIDRVDAAHANDHWPVSGLGTALAAKSPLMRRLLFQSDFEVKLDALLFAFTTNVEGLKFVDLLNSGTNDPERTAPQQAEAVVGWIKELEYTSSSSETILSQVCLAFQKVYQDKAPTNCRNVPTCNNPAATQPGNPLVDGINSGVQTAGGLMMAAGMMPPPFDIFGIIAGLGVGAAVGAFQGIGEQKAACEQQCRSC